MKAEAPKGRGDAPTAKPEGEMDALLLGRTRDLKVGHLWWNTLCQSPLFSCGCIRVLSVSAHSLICVFCATSPSPLKTDYVSASPS